MEFNAEKLDTANAKITTTITKDAIEAKFEKIAKDASKNLDVAGFRKGKVPVSVVKQRYKDSLTQDAENESFRDLYQKALKELEIEANKIIGEPIFDKYDKKDDGNIEIEMTISCSPTVELGEYKECVPEVEDKEVTDEEVDTRIEEMASSSVPYVSIEEDRAVENGDRVIVDFEGFVDEVAFEGGKAEKYGLVIGSGSFIPGFEDQIIGLNKGDEKDITVTFPENYQADNLAGKEAVFKIKLHDIEIKGEAVINDELAQKLLPAEENATVATLKEKIKEQLKSEKMGKYYREDLKPVLLDNLLEKINFDLPKNILEQEVVNAVNNKARSMSEDEIKEIQEDTSKLDKIKEEVTPDAQKSVKATFIIDALAHAEEVSVSDQEVSQVIYFEAYQSGQNPQDVLKYYSDNGYLPGIKMSMIEDKLISKLLDDKLGK
jgi:trigger factor